MKTYTATLLTILVLTTLGLAACDSTEPDDHGPGEGELITRVVLTLTGGGETVTATADDPDGDGLDLEIDPLTLRAGVTYEGTIELYNDLADDPDEQDITEEIREEADEHQLFYTPQEGVENRITVTVTDQDDEGLPVGLSFELAVTEGEAAAGSLQVVLSHYDDEPKDGETRSDETDLDVTFPVLIE